MSGTQCYQLRGTMTALSSITHFGDSAGGTEQTLRRERVIQADGTSVDVPIISGNSWRGQLRDCGVRAMLDELAVALDRPVTLSPPAFYLLFSGGALTKDAGRGLDMGLARRLRQLVPILSVLGGAVGRQILEGKAQFEKIVPVCAETADVLPDDLRAHPHAASTIYGRLGLEHYTRMDDAKRETLAGAYLPAPEQRLMEAPATRKVTNKRTGKDEEIADAPGVAQQMRYGFEVFSAGTVFSCGVTLNYVTPLEFEAFMVALREWSRTSIIGGKAATGLGRVQLNFPGWARADPRLARDTAAVSTAPFGALWQQHLHTHGNEIMAALGSLD